ncbi:MAG: ACP phosphodiesterase [Gammaproteobacteria bacterium]|nr:ACP phosphodiesterase [Gammaproteobacteria bacterium]
MNYLLHCWLGRSDPSLQAGGFLGDFIKGTLEDDIPSDLKRGLLLHRHIDVQSNRLPSMRRTYHRFGTELRRAAPILLDLMADHVFAKHWEEFGTGELGEFTQSCYDAIERYEIPTSAQRFYEHMRRTDLLARYSQLDVIEGIMLRILKRLRFTDLEEDLSHRLRENEVGFRDDFETYFRDLQAVSAAWCEKASSAPRI